MNLLKIAVLLPLVLWQSASAPSPAQSARNNGKEYYSEPLKDIPELPNLPLRQVPTKFNSGIVYPSASGGATYILFLSSRQNVAQLTSAYQQILASAGWKIRQEYLGKGEVEGNHPSGAFCNVSINAGKQQQGVNISEICVTVRMLRKATGHH